MVIAVYGNGEPIRSASEERHCLILISIEVPRNKANRRMKPVGIHLPEEFLKGEASIRLYQKWVINGEVCE